MANTIQIKRKTTSGAPAVGSLADGELCLVVPDSALYMRVNGTTLIELTNQGGGGGGGAPTENVIMDAIINTGQNINGSAGSTRDLQWVANSQDTGEITSFTNNDTQITITNAGWINIHASAWMSDSAINNRNVWGIILHHHASGGAVKYSYAGDMQYNRDDNNAYDGSGGHISNSMVYVEAGDYFRIEFRKFDGATTTASYLDSTYSKLRIAKVEF